MKKCHIGFSQAGIFPFITLLPIFQPHETNTIYCEPDRCWMCFCYLIYICRLKCFTLFCTSLISYFWWSQTVVIRFTRKKSHLFQKEIHPHNVHLFKHRVKFTCMYYFILCPIIGSQNDNIRALLIHIALKFMQMGINTGFALLFSIFMHIYSHRSKYFSNSFFLPEKVTGQEIKS